MAYIDVKITDLTQLSSLKNNDMFLVSQAVYDSDSGSLDLKMPYTSNSISYEDLKHSIESADLSIESNWDFVGGKDNIPTQNAKLEISGLVGALEDAEKLDSIVNDANEDGWYNKLTSSVLQKSPIDSSDSLSVTNNSIPNVDFVERAIAGAYQSLLNQLTTIISPSGSSRFIPSHIGEIVITTKFSTADDSEDGSPANGFDLDNVGNATNIRQVYGYGQTINGVKYPNTKWIQHAGYLLKGARSDVSANNSESDGGTDDQEYDVPLKAHDHSITTSSFSNMTASGGDYVYKVSASAKDGYKDTGGGGRATAVYSVSSKSGPVSVAITYKDQSIKEFGKTANTGIDPATITINPFPYKNVYIWERIS